jgi:putative radical SAM enzyme (TIGR03279 family)
MPAEVPQQNHARIAAVITGSIAEELGVQPGDVVAAVNGAPPADYIAYRFAIADEVVTLDVLRDGETLSFEIEKDADEDLGLIFEHDVFDGVRRCANNCVFCFEQQMPAGMRASLGLRDDDYRLSFLHGNFLTLTNLTAQDRARIIREHLSPLFVSIHATDPDVRRRLLRHRNAGEILDQLRDLSEHGIELHGQIVLCPGWNDGAVLARTLDDLAVLHPMLLSVGVVPVGLTGHRPAGPAVRPVTAEDACAVLDLVEARQAAWQPELGTRLVFAADEFYLAAGRVMPPAEAYEDFAQQENGIGLARLFLDDVALLELPPLLPRRVTLATGTLAAPLLETLAARLHDAGAVATVVAVPNHFYSGGVSVAGLLTGADLRAALAGRDLGDALILPAVVLNADGIFLDDTTPDELETALGVPIYFCGGVEEVVEVVESLAMPDDESSG